MDEDSLAVVVRDASKCYGNHEVLKSLNMDVQRGAIYGLLGASGCGKTTLLWCIVGRKPLDSGEVRVFGRIPGQSGSGVPGSRVGFMPQETALVGRLTVKDIIFYFGRIMNMSDRLINQRLDELSQVLDLPPQNKLIVHCSGGQQRRVSLAASMVHMPELLILDEPTVGVDPVLRERIWEYLTDIAKKQKIAVIITTHYIEETRQANVIGLMRHGRLLAQASPTRLLEKFETQYLEDVYFTLSQKQQVGTLDEYVLWESPDVESSSSNGTSTFEIDHLAASSEATTNKTRKLNTKTVGSFALNTRRIRALLDKNVKKFYRNTPGFLLALLFPIVEILVFFFAVGNDVKNINLAIVNEETMTTSCQNYSNIDSFLYNPETYSCDAHNLSCKFLSFLENPMIHKVGYNSLSEAFMDVRRGKVVGAVYMATNFTDSFLLRIGPSTLRLPYEVVDESQIKVWLDMSNRQIGESMKFRLLSLYVNFHQDVLRSCNKTVKSAVPYTLDTVYGHKDDIFTIFMVPGIIMTLMFFVSSVLAAHIILDERHEGIWDRSIISGVSSLELTVTHLCLHASIVALYVVEVLVTTFAIFKMEYVGEIWILVVLSYLQGLVGWSFGFFTSVVSNSHTMSLIIGTGSFYFMIFICGLLWPIQGMPVFLQYISKIFPFTLAIDSFRNVMKKGWPVTDVEVFNGILVEIAWIILFLTISTLLIKARR